MAESNENTDFLRSLDVIYLSACALHGKTPEREIVDQMELTDVYKQAARQSMRGITYKALSLYISAYGRDALPIEDALLNRWKYSLAMTLKRTVQFDIERERIFNFMESHGIWYMPMKGLVLQNYYPALGMRQMCDNDILFDSSRREELRDFMLENGYSAGDFGGEYPDSYFKGDLSFEMHHHLMVDTDRMKSFRRYYDNVKDRLVRDGDSEYRLRFTKEDFYIYMTCHAYKHYSGGGNGIRSFADFFVYNDRVGGELDRKYLAEEFDKLGLRSFEERMRSLSDKLFCAECINFSSEVVKLTREEIDFLGYHVDSGTYGSVKIISRKKLDKLAKNKKITPWVKLKYCFDRIFPEMEFYRFNYPTAYKYKILIPVVVIYRLFRGLFLRPKARAKEIKMLIKRK